MNMNVLLLLALAALARPVTIGLPAAATTLRSTGQSSLENTYVFYRSSTLWKKWRWGLGLDEYKLLKLQHRDPVTKETRDFSYSCSFKIVGVAAQEPGQNVLESRLWVAGITDTGDSVIERWVHKPKKAQIPGTPLAYTLSRTPLTGLTLGTIDRIQVEPAGKFLVVAHHDTQPHLSQISLGPAQVVTPLLGPGYQSVLDKGVLAIDRAEHQTEGLLWMVYIRDSILTGGDWALVLRDLDGDDVLDDWMSYTYDMMQSDYPSRFDRAPWIDDFKTY